MRAATIGFGPNYPRSCLQAVQAELFCRIRNLCNTRSMEQLECKLLIIDREGEPNTGDMSSEYIRVALDDT